MNYLSIYLCVFIIAAQLAFAQGFDTNKGIGPPGTEPEFEKQSPMLENANEIKLNKVAEEAMADKKEMAMEVDNNEEPSQVNSRNK